MLLSIILVNLVKAGELFDVKIFKSKRPALNVKVGM